MKVYNDGNIEHIIETMTNNSLSRNTMLINFMKMIAFNSSNDIFAINGSWGTGKTFFVKQLELLINFINNFNENGDYKNKYLAMNEIKCLKELTEEQKAKLNTFINSKGIRNLFDGNQTNCLYFNAWEYDNNDNPILSIIYKIINDFPYLSANFPEDKEKLFLSLLDTVSTHLTNGCLEISKYVHSEDLIKDIITSEELKDKINKIFDDLMVENCNHLVLIIDELDRCKPTFALKLLESLKHFINNDKITIVLVTNIYQLSNTIKNIYGSRFDVEEYLDKIIDITYTLKPINRNDYVRSCGLESFVGSSNWFSESVLAYVNYRKLEMRSINRFVKKISMYEKYVYLSRPNRSNMFKLLEYIFLPYYLGEQIFNTNNHNEFVKGTGFNEFYNYVSTNKYLISIINECLYGSGSEDDLSFKDDLKRIYDLMYNNKTGTYSVKLKTGYFDMSNVEYFNDLCTSLNDYNIIVDD